MSARVATDAGFRQMSMTLIPLFPKWESLDDYIDSMHGWFQGEFDPTKFNHWQEELQKDHGNGAITQSEPITRPSRNTNQTNVLNSYI